MDVLSPAASGPSTPKASALTPTFKADGDGAMTPQGLANFGIVLTGRLSLRNELLSTFSIGMDMWDERYFVLTRKGLHYYVRQRDSTETSRRDLFGEHEGSIALGNISQIDLGGEEYRSSFIFLIISKGGGRRYMLKAINAELYQRWVSTLQAAIAPSLGTVGRSNSGTHSALNPVRGIRSSSSFPRIPTLLDFRTPNHTDNLSTVTLYSSSLNLELLLESGLPWGMQTTIERKRHRVSCTLLSTASSASADVLRLHLEGGATATIPLGRTLLRRSRGTVVVPLQSPTVHKAIRLSWEPTSTAQPVAPAMAKRRATALSPTHQAATVLAAAALFASALVSEEFASDTKPRSAAGSLRLMMSGLGSSLGMASIVPPSLLRPLLLLVAVVAAAYALNISPAQMRRDGARFCPQLMRLAGRFFSRRAPLRFVRRLPTCLVRRIPGPLAAAIVSAAQPDAWALSLVPADEQVNHKERSKQSATMPHAAHEDHPHPLPPHAAVMNNLAPASPARSAALADSELHVDALFADVASDEHSVLWHAAVALRHAYNSMLPPSTGGESYPVGHSVASAPSPAPHAEGAEGGAPAASPSPAPPRADGAADKEAASKAKADAKVPTTHSLTHSPTHPLTHPLTHSPTHPLTHSLTHAKVPTDVHMESLLRAFDVSVVQVLSALGPAMLILVKNDQANMRKTRDAATAAHLPTGSVRALLEDEVSRGMHEQSPHPEATNASTGSGTAAVKERSAILYDPSAAISLLWLLRSLKFTVVLMQRLEAAQQKLEDERAIAPLEVGRRADPSLSALRLPRLALPCTCLASLYPPKRLPAQKATRPKGTLGTPRSLAPKPLQTATIPYRHRAPSSSHSPSRLCAAFRLPPPAPHPPSHRLPHPSTGYMGTGGAVRRG